MKAKNQLVVISGILALLATATIAASYNVQTVNAQSSHQGTDNFGQNTVKPYDGPKHANDGKPGLGPHDISGSVVSNCARNGGC